MREKRTQFERPRIPFELGKAAGQVGGRFGRQIFTDDLFLVGIIEGADGDPARLALEALGPTG